MRVRAVAMAFALTLTAATAARAQSDVPAPGMQDGVVAQIDTAAGVVKLEDGRIAWSRAPSSSSRDTRPSSMRSSPAATSRSTAASGWSTVTVGTCGAPRTDRRRLSRRGVHRPGSRAAAVAKS